MLNLRATRALARLPGWLIVALALGFLGHEL
jgi:hypothetical protein